MADRSRDSERVARTAVKPGRGTPPRSAREAVNRRPRTTTRAGGTTRAARTVPGRGREVAALVMFGVAIFLFFVLVAGAKGGFVGRGANTGLHVVVGRLAFLLPVALLGLAVTTVLEFKLRRAPWFAGILLFLFGLVVLMAGGFPPVGGHEAAGFVRLSYEARSGAIGEVLYALLHRLVGDVGVGIIGWLTLVAGAGLGTGMTLKRLGSGTKRTARAVKSGAESATLRMRSREGRVSGTMAGATRNAFDDLGSGSLGPRLGPVDLVGRLQDTDSSAQTVSIGASARAGSPSPFAGEFDDWEDGEPAGRSPLAPFGSDIGSSRAVIDGAAAFADIYGHPTSESGRRTGSFSGSATSMDPAPARQGARAGMIGGAGAGGEAGVGGMAAVVAAVAAGNAANAGVALVSAGQMVGRAGVAAVASGEESAGSTMDPRQETLPGMAPPARKSATYESHEYVLPEADLLRKSAPLPVGQGRMDRDTAAVLLQALAQFGVEARVLGMVVGPRVTRYELQLAPGTKVSKVSNLKDDLAYALASTEIRILAPIPGKSAVGVEVPNQRPDFVTLGDIYRDFPKSAGPLMVWLGKDISGKAVYTDLTRLPHLLIAGTTGSGKSGCINCLVSSVLLRSTPEQVRFIMIDPKKVELSHYDRIPHLLVPVVTNMKDAAGVLHNVAKEMEDRYELMELEHARNLAEMNKSRARRGERPLPYILIVIDELADLMMVSPQEVEDYVIRLAQKSRAVGIHLVVATQRPSADVITGMIKANIPSRIAFAVSSQTDSRVILDVNGAETLLGMGDMLFKPLGSSHLQRVQGAYITEEEIAVLVGHWRHQGDPEFREELLRRPAEVKKEEEGLFDPDSDDLLVDAAQLVLETGSASVSMLQRRLRVGYTRAGRLIDMLERRGIVGPWEGSKPRQVLVEPEEFEHLLNSLHAEEYPGDGPDCD